MTTWEELMFNERVKVEYIKSFLLNLFQKICAKMNRDSAFKKKVQTLFRQSFNKLETTQLIVKSNLNYELSIEDAELMLSWFEAYFRKNNQRKSISQEDKKRLFERQGGRCMCCGELLSIDWSKIHVDHIIPWKLVGDELPDNYQLLCETCNECKSARTDYIFKSLINLT